MLAKMLRQEEAHLEKVTGYRVKYLEKSGQNLGSQLVRSNPWSCMDCGRLGCLLGETKSKSGKKPEPKLLQEESDIPDVVPYL